MLLKIDDPVVAHEYWKAGLLFTTTHQPWAEYKWYVRNADYNNPLGTHFLASMCSAFINIEE